VITYLGFALKSLCVCQHHFNFLFLSANNFPFHTALQSPLVLQYTAVHCSTLPNIHVVGDTSENKKFQYIKQKILLSQCFATLKS